MANNTLIYVGAEASGLYRKEAADSSWEQLSDGMPPSPQARAIAIHPENPDLVFVGTQRGVYRSQDRGGYSGHVFPVFATILTLVDLASLCSQVHNPRVPRLEFQRPDNSPLRHVHPLPPVF